MALRRVWAILTDLLQVCNEFSRYLIYLFNFYWFCKRFWILLDKQLSSTGQQVGSHILPFNISPTQMIVSLFYVVAASRRQFPVYPRYCWGHTSVQRISLPPPWPWLRLPAYLSGTRWRRKSWLMQTCEIIIECILFQHQGEILAWSAERLGQREQYQTLIRAQQKVLFCTSVILL